MEGGDIKLDGLLRDLKMLLRRQQMLLTQRLRAESRCSVCLVVDLSWRLYPHGHVCNPHAPPSDLGEEKRLRHVPACSQLQYSTLRTPPHAVCRRKEVKKAGEASQGVRLIEDADSGTWFRLGTYFG